MKKKSISKASKGELKPGTAIRAQDIKLSAEHPEADPAHIMRAIVRRGLRLEPSKTSISLRLDADVLEWYKSQGPGYQTRINAVLRAFRDASR